jgi:hypothetical protein
MAEAYPAVGGSRFLQSTGTYLSYYIAEDSIFDTAVRTSYVTFCVPVFASHKNLGIYWLKKG